MTNEKINQDISKFIGSSEIKDFCNDLNAMHEAENHLDVDQEYDYGEELRKISDNVGPKGGHFTPNGWGCYALAHLKAKEKAQAFAKVISIAKTKSL